MVEFQPATSDELVRIVAAAGAGGRKLELRGAGTKSLFGGPREADVVDLRALNGIVDYDPAELVLTALAGTPLAEIKAAVADNNQCLTFDPWEAGPLFGGSGEGATIGGSIVAGIAGPRRISGGGARDHLLGFKAVSGHGERFAAGAKVVKNVTGFDLSKLVTGSWGQLVALTELTLKVMPRPSVAMTLALRGLTDASAVEAMSAGLGSSAEIAAVAHLPYGLSPGDDAVTFFQLRGFEPSVVARRALLASVLGGWGALDLASGQDEIWSIVREVRPLAAEPVVWRVIIPPSQVAPLLATLNPAGPRLIDWGGNLLWLSGQADPLAVRKAAVAAGGHATLVRAPETMREQVPALHPPAPAVAAIEARVRHAFDPFALFRTGRFRGAKYAD